ncbi:MULTISPECIES: IclR family transcriptional regulator [unclassified Rhizobium]|uniref:IclR family transcriptional regulator n=1 Tax=unclassified Rhizobium TaxID=2613769 RepID=UPI001ADCF7AF|nr:MULTISPECIES: IclR family transcriptional regulator [unclassified Rhizobium]MBO9099838.1 IclR family transcriptional regulator [Rhizobium sp. L58/93]MBO9131620.1 IclR family transcriptional regulator [Rhizobium sp. B209b/85]MBO9169827.1 IclR family transcriptional regulator [Rhizobium sp. L245/93]MBO9185785.1 IclR family transcriptional regulator [Rhizobium sp. E27B/91]QXZ82547.1 IclR family transcriptional regulator [Rhizobium sp. K1/93]
MASADEEGDRYRAPALDKGLDILELLARIDGGLTQAEIAKHLGKSPNEFYRMLDRLVRRGYVQRQEGDRFLLTLKLFGLAHFHAPVRRLVSFSTPLMREFANRAEQACHLAVFDRGSVAIIAQQDSPTYWGISIRVGAQISLFNTGSGHVLLAFRDEKQRQMMIDEQQRRDDDVAMPGDLIGRLQVIRERGFETMDSLQTTGVRNISAPILARDGNALAALTCPYIQPVSDKAPSFDQVKAFVRAAAAEISETVAGMVDDAG